jgi:hypothetical protein
MSSSDAQRSPVHQSTEDSNLEPSNPSRQPGTAARSDAKTRPDDSDTRGPRDAGGDADVDAESGAAVIGGGPGAGDGSSGGGAGAGIPGGGTDMRTDGAFNTGDVEEDRKRLFPESSGEKTDRNDPDESSFGGPLKIDDPSAS